MKWFFKKKHTKLSTNSKTNCSIQDVVSFLLIIRYNNFILNLCYPCKWIYLQYIILKTLVLVCNVEDPCDY